MVSNGYISRLGNLYLLRSSSFLMIHSVLDRLHCVHSCSPGGTTHYDCKLPNIFYGSGSSIHTLILLSRHDAQAMLALCLPFSPFSFAAGFIGAALSLASWRNILLLAVVVLGIVLSVRCPTE